MRERALQPYSWNYSIPSNRSIGFYDGDIIVTGTATFTGGILSPVRGVIDPRLPPYNCKGDGATNDYTGMRLAILDAISTGKTVDGGFGIYIINDGLSANGRNILSFTNVTAPVNLQNLNLKFDTNLGTGFVTFAMLGPALGAVNNLTSNFIPNLGLHTDAVILNVTDGSQFVAGDVLILQSNAPGDYSVSTKASEFVVVKSVTANALSLECSPSRSFLVTDVARVQKLDRRFQPNFKNVTFEAADAQNAYGPTITRAYNAQTDADCKILGCKSIGAIYIYCYRGYSAYHVSGCNRVGLGYAFDLAACSDMTCELINAFDIRTGYASGQNGGISSRRLLLKNFLATDVGGACFDTHQGSFNGVFEGAVINNGVALADADHSFNIISPRGWAIGPCIINGRHNSGCAISSSGCTDNTDPDVISISNISAFSGKVGAFGFSVDQTAGTYGINKTVVFVGAMTCRGSGGINAANRCGSVDINVDTLDSVSDAYHGILINELLTVAAGDITAGNVTITNVTNIANITVGAYIAGVGIKPGTKVLSKVVSPPSITLDALPRTTGIATALVIGAPHARSKINISMASTLKDTSQSTSHYTALILGGNQQGQRSTLTINDGEISRDDPILLNTIGDITTGSNIISNLGSPVGLVVGKSVTAEGVPFGATISSVAGLPSSVTISANATLTIAANPISFGNPSQRMFSQRGDIVIGANVALIGTTKSNAGTSGGGTIARISTAAVIGF